MNGKDFTTQPPTSGIELLWIALWVGVFAYSLVTVLRWHRPFKFGVRVILYSFIHVLEYVFMRHDKGYWTTFKMVDLKRFKPFDCDKCMAAWIAVVYLQTMSVSIVDTLFTAALASLAAFLVSQAISRWL